MLGSNAPHIVCMVLDLGTSAGIVPGNPNVSLPLHFPAGTMSLQHTPCQVTSCQLSCCLSQVLRPRCVTLGALSCFSCHNSHLMTPRTPSGPLDMPLSILLEILCLPLATPHPSGFSSEAASTGPDPRGSRRPSPPSTLHIYRGVLGNKPMFLFTVMGCWPREAPLSAY